MFPKIPNQFRFLIVGSSNSGKSSLCARLIKHREKCFDVQPKRIAYYCRFKAGVHKSIRNEVEIYQHFPTEDDFLNESGEPLLIILDDFGDQALSSHYISTAFKTARHNNVSLIMLLHTLFSNKKESREISLNSTGLFLMKSCRDMLSVKNLSYQLDPVNPNILTAIYSKYVTKPFEYVFVDLDVRTHNLLRFRTKLFNANSVQVFINDEATKSLPQEQLSSSQLYSYVLRV